MTIKELGPNFTPEWRNDLNNNFKELDGMKGSVDDAVNKAKTAEQVANEAKIKSDTANDMSNSVQNQLDTIVINGDSSVEAAQARVDANGQVHNTLKERNDSDFNSINTDRNLPNLNNLYLSIFYKKMQTEPVSPYGNAVNITCQGDSMTQGNGATTGNDYPTQLQSFLNSIARPGQVVTVVNRGIGGDTTKMSYEHWPTPSGSDLCIIYLGTNDFNKNTTMKEFVDYYERIIKREISNGTAVFLVTPHRWRKADWLTKPWNGSVSDYASVIKNIGKKYNAPVLDLLSETRNLDRSAYKTGEADPGIHFGDIGYQMLSRKLGAMLGFQHPSTLPIVKNNSFISVRPSIDGIKKPDEYYIMHSSTSYPTPREYAPTSNEGIGIMAEATEKVFHYSFYADEDNLFIIPSFFFTTTDGTEKIEVTINGNNIPFQPNNAYQYNQTLDRTLPSGQISLTMADFPDGHAKPTTTQNIFANSEKAYYRYLPTKGWYTVTVKIANCRFHGFDFLNTDHLNSKNNTAKKNDVVTKIKDGRANLTLTADATNPDINVPPTVDRRGSTVNLSMSVQRNAGSSNLVVAVLPTDLRPAVSQAFYVSPTDGTTPIKVVIGTNGNIQVLTAGKSLYIVSTYTVDN